MATCKDKIGFRRWVNLDILPNSTEWPSFLPRFVLSRLEAQASNNWVEEQGRLPASALFLDILGFTPMSEALAAHGSYGTEELTRLLNGWFGPVVEIVTSYGGDVAGFGGDALIGLFPVGGGHARSALRRAIQCALTVQDRMHDFASLETRAGTFTLRMKAGISSGRAMWTIVGDPEIRLTCLVGGRLLQDAASAADFATGSEVVVDKKDIHSVGRAEWGRRRKPGPVVKALARAPQPASAKPITRPKPSALRVFVHSRIAELLETGHAQFVNEHRRVTIMFVGFRGPDYDDPDAGMKLRKYFREVSEIIEYHGGYLEQIETADKGSKYIALFGAPVARENDVERALDCALDLVKRSTFDPRIGITTGHAFCGLIGNYLRREYVVIGDSVNLAARLMQRATPGTILADRGTRDKTSLYRWHKQETIAVKGKQTLIRVARLRSKKPLQPMRERGYDLPFVGRARELKRSHQLLNRAIRGRGQIIQLSGEAGIGKSRLSAEVMESAQDMGFRTLGGTSPSYGKTLAYATWKPIIRGLLDMSIRRSKDQEIQNARQRLRDIDPALVPRLPLLSPMLGIIIPDTETTSGLGPDLRVQSLKSLILDVLLYQSARIPLAIVLEDCQWLDEPSKDLLQFVGDNLADVPIALLIVYRAADYGDSPFPEIRLQNSSSIHLTPLGGQESEQLATFKLRALRPTESIDVDDIADIARKGQGNPFYLEELVNFLHGPLRTSPKEHITVPETLTSLIMARLDSLKEEERTTLKVASVVGRSFSADWIAGTYPRGGSSEEVARRLMALERLDLAPRRGREGGHTHIFKHALIQQVAYESLSFDARAMLHEQIGDFIESRFSTELSNHTDELAHHYGHSRNMAKQRIYFRRAADQAKSNFANDSAIGYYERLISLLPIEEQGAVLRSQGEVQQLVGKWKEAEATFRRALSVAQRTRNPVDKAQSQAALGYLLSYTESFDRSLPWLNKAHQGFVKAGESRGVIQVLEYLSHTHFELGNFASAIKCSTEQLRMAEELEDLFSQTSALENLGRTHWHNGNPRLALDYLHQALLAAEESGNRKGTIHACNDIAGLYSDIGDAQEAMVFLQRALKAADEIGYRLLAGMTIGNAGLLYRERGQYEEALDCYLASLRIGAELRDLPGVFAVLGELSILQSKTADVNRADELFRRTVDLGRELNNPFLLCEYLYHWAESCASKADWPRVEPLLHEALALAVKLDRKDYILRCLLLKTELELRLGKTSMDSAVTAIQSLLDKWQTEEDRAAIHYQLWAMTRREESRAMAALLYTDLYESSQRIEHKKRVEVLTEKPVADPEPLPPLDISSAGPPVELETVLARVSELLSSEAITEVA